MKIMRQRRKQSNRESARRSRLRKQAECEELSIRVHKLSEENLNLQTELSKMKQKCETLTCQNKILQQELHSFASKKQATGTNQGESTEKPQVEPQGEVKEEEGTKKEEEVVAKGENK